MTTDSVEPANSAPAVETTATTPLTAALPPELTSTTTADQIGAWPDEPDVLLGTMEGILFQGEPYAAGGVPIFRLVDDLNGGLVYQTAPEPGSLSSELWWLPAGQEDPVLLLELPEWRGFRGLLHQVAQVAGERRIVLTRDVGPEDDEPEEHLELIELVGGAEPGQRVIQTGGIEWGAQSVSFAAGVFLIVEVNHSCGDMKMVDLSGRPIDASSIPEPPCEVHFEVPFIHGRLSPDGSLLAYVAQTYEFSEDLGYPVVIRSDLVVGDVETGDELIRRRVTDQVDERVVSMDFDGEWLVWVQKPPGGEPELSPTGSGLFGLHLDGSEFQVTVEDVWSVWLPRQPLQGP